MKKIIQIRGKHIHTLTHAHARAHTRACTLATGFSANTIPQCEAVVVSSLCNSAEVATDRDRERRTESIRFFVYVLSDISVSIVLVHLSVCLSVVSDYNVHIARPSVHAM